MIALTYAWSDSAAGVTRDAAVEALLPAQPWTHVLVDDDDPDFEAWIHVYIGQCHLQAPSLRQLLRMAADDALGGLVLFDDTLQWLYAPYDGGADVILQTTEERDRLRDEHSDWLSTHPGGL